MRHGTYHLVDGTEDLVDTADLGLVLQVNGSIKVRNLLVDGLAHHVAFTGEHKGSHGLQLDLVRR